MFEEIYHEYLVHKNKQNVKERYKGKESWYHASGAGFCSRKLYYESVEQAVPTNPPNKLSMRKMGVGTIVHEDIQNALIYYNNIYNNIYNKENNKDISKLDIVENMRVKFDVEGEIELPELNVRGYYDIVTEEDNSIGLYDIKTSANFSWKLKFSSKNVRPQENRNHFLQLGTYGLAVKKKYGRLDQMGIIYYNKDTSVMRKVNVPIDYIRQARLYWHSVNDEHSKGDVPRFQLGTSPVYKWCCNYCQFKDHCKPPSVI